VPSIRKKTDPYLSKRFKNSSGITMISHRYQMVAGFAKTLIDRAIVGILGTDHVDSEFIDKDTIKEIKGLDNGFILIMSHVGCWQVAMSALDLFQKPVNLLMQLNEKDIDKHYYEHGENDKPFNIINPEGFLGGAIEMLNVLKKGEILCMMGDRVFGDAATSVNVSFLGETAGFPFSAFKMASLSKKPVVVMYSFKSGPAHYKMKIGKVIHVPEKLGKSKERYQPYVSEYIETLEAFTREEPYQVFNFYDMWK
jgi:predicted LPLAT superfamily acyltransferase